MKTNYKLFPLIVASTFLVGCGGGGAIAGLWDFTEGDDVEYQEIKANGEATNYDYQGDAAGSGENCYDRFGPITLVHEGGNSYNGLGEIFTAEVNGDTITISDSFGTNTYPRLTGLSTTDFNIC